MILNHKKLKDKKNESEHAQKGKENVVYIRNGNGVSPR
jgi:hypothetical protein